MLTGVVVGVLVGLAVFAATGPRGRGAGSVTGRACRGGAVGSRPGLPWAPDLDGGQQHEPPASLQVLVTQVAALLRSGLPPGQAWGSCGAVRVDRAGIPDAADLVRAVAAAAPATAATGRAARASRAVQAALRGLRRAVPRRCVGPHARPARGRRRRAVSRHVSRAQRATQADRQAAAIVAACRLAGQVGAPLAVVLESIVATLVAAAQAEEDRDVALAGPRSTARVLLWLPVAGAALGSALGADPVGLLLGGGPTALAPVAGLLLLGVGRRWTARLVRRARAAGSPP